MLCRRFTAKRIALLQICSFCNQQPPVAKQTGEQTRGGVLGNVLLSSIHNPVFSPANGGSTDAAGLSSYKASGLQDRGLRF